MIVSGLRQLWLKILAEGHPGSATADIAVCVYVEWPVTEEGG